VQIESKAILVTGPHILDSWLIHGSWVDRLTRPPPVTLQEDSRHSFLLQVE
jgi:hypothetical protein